MIAIVIAWLVAMLTATAPAPAVVPASPLELAAPDGAIGPVAAGVQGNVGYAEKSYGRHYLAMRLPRGTSVRVCGPGGCLNLVTTDYGPSAKIRPPRIADLSWWDWLTICGVETHLTGLCHARATMLEHIELPATDTAP